MKKRKKIISAFLAAACMAMLLLTQAVAAPALTFGGQINWTNEPDTDTLRPESVTVYLLADGEQIAQTETSAEENWHFSFAVLPDSAVSTYIYSAAPVIGYEEDTEARVDPKVETVPMVIGGWEKYEPCNSLTIPQEVLSDMLIAGKMTKHQPLVIWSREPLTKVEQETVETAVRALPGVGNPPPAEFISGDGAEKYGMQISLADGTVNFDDPSQWALLFGSTYTGSKVGVSEGSLTLRWIPVLDPPTDPNPDQPGSPPSIPGGNDPGAPDTPHSPNPPTGPGTPGTSPTVPGKPAANGSGTVVAAKTGMPADYYVGLCGFVSSIAAIACLLIWKKTRKAEKILP